MEEPQRRVGPETGRIEAARQEPARPEGKGGKTPKGSGPDRGVEAAPFPPVPGRGIDGLHRRAEGTLQQVHLAGEPQGLEDHETRSRPMEVRFSATGTRVWPRRSPLGAAKVWVRASRTHICAGTGVCPLRTFARGAETRISWKIGKSFSPSFFLASSSCSSP